MGMCKNCGTVVSILEMTDGYCKKCNVSLESKKKNLNLQVNEYENTVKEIKLLYAIFGEPSSKDIISNVEHYKKYLDISTSDYFFGGMLLSDFLSAYKKRVENQKANDILDDKFTISEKFIADTIINIVVDISKKKNKSLKKSLQLLFIILEDKKTINYTIEQLEYISINNVYVSPEAYQTVITVQNFHLFLIKQFVQQYRQY